MYETKMGGRALRARPPHFRLYLFSYTFDFFGFGPIFDQFFWDFILKNNSKLGYGEFLVLTVMVIDICFFCYYFIIFYYIKTWKNIKTYKTFTFFNSFFLIFWIIFQNKIPKKLVKNWSKAKKIKSVRKKVQPKMGGRARSARPPIFVSYILEYTFDFFGFGPIFDQFFWDFILKNY